MARTLFSFCVELVLFRIRSGRTAIPAVLLLVLVLAGLVVPASAGAGYDLLFILLLSQLLVWAGTTSEPGAALEPLFRYLGVISFPIYALHWPLLQFASGM